MEKQTSKIKTTPTAVLEKLREVIDAFRLGDEIILHYTPKGHAPEVTRGDHSVILVSACRATMCRFIPNMVDAAELDATQLFALMAQHQLREVIDELQNEDRNHEK